MKSNNKQAFRQYLKEKPQKNSHKQER